MGYEFHIPFLCNRKMANYQKQKSLIDKSFVESRFNNYQLFVLISNSELSLTVLDSKSRTFIAFENYVINDVYSAYSLVEILNSILAENTILSKRFNKKSVSFISNRSTLVPKALYNPNELKKVHQFNFTTFEEDIYMSDYILNLSAYTVFSVPDFLLNTVNKLGNVEIHHFSTALIENNLIHSKRNNQLEQLDVHILPQTFQISYINNQTLKYYNSFEYQTSEDFIYYLLFVLEQLNINSHNATIRLTGAIDKNSTLYELMKKYLKKIDFIETPNELNYSHVFEQLPKHYYHILFNQYLCE